MANPTDAGRDMDKIVWPKEPHLSNPRAWKRNVEVVKMLTKLGTVTAWERGEDRDDRYKLPRRYKIEGVQVEFLPHWGQYNIQSVTLDVPKSAEDVLAAVRAVKALLSYGLARKQE